MQPRRRLGSCLLVVVCSPRACEYVCLADIHSPSVCLLLPLYVRILPPQALIWSAVAASSAFPGLFHPQDLLARNAMGEEVRCVAAHNPLAHVMPAR